jgi:antitoxin HicB
MKYPATFTQEKAGITVTFRDIPEAITQGDDLADALFMAKDVLLAAIEVYFEEKRQVPKPSAVKAGDHPIRIPPSVAAKVLLLNQMLQKKVIPAELARRMGTTPQEINRLIDLHHATKIDRIAQALEALGAELNINTRSA